MARAQTRTISCAAAVLGLCSIAVAQQSPAPPAETPTTPQAAPQAAPEAVAPPTKAPAVKPSEAPAPGLDQGLVGLDVFSSDGTRIGEVRSVNTSPAGSALHVKTGGFLGFGGRIVAIPEGRFTRSGQSIRVDLNSTQVNDLPTVRE